MGHYQRYFVNIAYKGFSYRGWQRQPLVTTIQEVIEDTMSRMLKQRIVCIGCGRTDAKVNASQFIFHFDFDQEWQFDFKFRLNKMLPDDICILDIIPVEGFPHAQFSATSRTYNYLIHKQKDSFLGELSSLYAIDLDINIMGEATRQIAKTNEFKHFCRCPNRHDSTLCTIYSAQLFKRNSGSMLRFEITADRFLQGMVRLLVQRLIEVGTGELTLGLFEDFLFDRQIPEKVRTAHPQGLYLSKVTYPFVDFDNKSSIFGEILENGWEIV